MKKTYEYRVYPNNKTKATINQILEACSWFYNYLLEQFRKRDQRGDKQPTKIELQDSLIQIKNGNPLPKQVQFHILQDVARRVCKTWQDYKRLKQLDNKKKHPNTYKTTFQYNEKKIVTVQQKLSQKVRGSQNWKDTKLQLTKKWEKVVNQAKHETYRVVNELVKKYDEIAVENLKVKEMIEKGNLAKFIQRARWAILFQVISDKASIAGRRLVRVNPKNTTQMCSCCGELSKEKLNLAQRAFECWNCNYKDDRDINSAKNIYKLGFDKSLLSEVGGKTFWNVL
ncbi:RNA-guided endonuclease InsQ/TnpB family protein [endosymbiont GvMRE of Glomus versiforme]|uniref:RNA-guided endonuclease InsQ/TnpB family protein n=1 Tax=endosymbiont GvMRE of Glomus versiforme TaxID=2039283 RepID=UPI000EE9347E|nr:RNA-guided endonuclease TnpB family protein [endosymbiont GvMRE of Glomus versiforme]RHZ35592.1 Transposase IS605 [endosymbiont GvMRE of Glomus versiforme]